MPRVTVMVKIVVNFMALRIYQVIVFHKVELQVAELFEKGFVVLEHLVFPEMQELALPVQTEAGSSVNMQMIIGNDPGEIVQSASDANENALGTELEVCIIQIRSVEQGLLKFGAGFIYHHPTRADSSKDQFFLQGEGLANKVLHNQLMLVILVSRIQKHTSANHCDRYANI